MAAAPDWVTLRIFLAAVELGSVTRAADRCGIATSAAAKRVQDLEADCGLLLLERGARGVKPTAAGEALARHARFGHRCDPAQLGVGRHDGLGHLQPVARADFAHRDNR